MTVTPPHPDPLPGGEGVICPPLPPGEGRGEGLRPRGMPTIPWCWGTTRMSKPFDITTRELIEGFPESWMAYLGLTPDGPIHAVDSNLDTLPAEADKVFRVDGPAPYLIHVEMQAGHDRSLPRRLWRYNALLDLRHDLRVRGVVVLLRPQADADNLTGVLDLRLPDGRRVVEFHYDVVRAWRQPVEPIL